MATKVDWGSIGSGDKEQRKSKLQFIKFESGKGKTFRPIGGAVEFTKFFVNGRAVVVDSPYADEASARMEAQSGQKHPPRTRFAINVIDREDGQIRILEGGPSIFKHFANWSKLNQGAPPGGRAGMDWSVMPEGEGLNREYSTMPICPAPLSQDEIKLANETKEKYTLTDVFAGCSMEEVVDKAFGDRSRGSDAPVLAPATTPAAPAPAPVATSELSDDPADW